MEYVDLAFATVTADLAARRYRMYRIIAHSIVRLGYGTIMSSITSSIGVHYSMEIRIATVNKIFRDQANLMMVRRSQNINAKHLNTENTFLDNFSLNVYRCNFSSSIFRNFILFWAGIVF
ncbi:hypothetical protein CDAR_103791 [Caerostris darwini]|uniref:Uncharacterized protein n=1 Tax=Caerostris darwini TaxID=1538125 RepID=A0AAV4NQP5_9ARAC|nr:hypothetical protein CDAR_103791 [Caerostris darwini]